MLLHGKWTNFDSSNSPLPSNWVRQLAAGPDGRVWMTVGMHGVEGILTFDDLKGRYFSLTDIGLPVLNYGDLICDSDGALWLYALVAGLLCRFDGMTVTMFHGGEKGLPAGSLLICDLTADMRGGLWAAMTNGGVYRYNGNEWLRMGPANSAANWNVSRMTVDHTGRIWFAVIEGKQVHFVWFNSEQYHWTLANQAAYVTAFKSCSA